MTHSRVIVSIGVALSIAVGGCGGSSRPDPQGSTAATQGVPPKPPLPGTSVAGTGAVATHALVMAQSAQLWPEFSLTSAGVPFTLGVDDGGVIRYVSTTDRRFVTPEGVHAGLDYRSVMAAAGGHAAIKESGWAHYVELPSGWAAAFVTGPGMTDGELTPESPVNWVFQRIGHGGQATTPEEGE